MSPRSRRPGTTRRRRARRAGAAAVEFAIVAPIFLLLLAGMIEFGQAFRVEHALSNAARRGARAAIVEGASGSQVIQKVKTHCTQTMGVDEEDVTVAIAVNGDAGGDLGGAQPQDEISITVSVPFSKVGVGFYSHFFSNAVLSATNTLEHE